MDLSSKSELNEQLNKRARRVKRLKSAIVIILLLLILLPTILCAVLFARLNRLEEMLSGDEVISRESVVAAADEMYASEDGVGAVNEAMAEWKTMNENAAAPDPGGRLTDDQPKYSFDYDTLVRSRMAASGDGVVPSEPVKTVYLTFDDGPSANTGRILDILDRYGIKATFFVVSTQNEDYMKYYKEIVDRGHSIGMHSATHVYSEVYASTESFLQDVAAIRGQIYDETGVMSSIYRFPGGSSNKVSKVDVGELEDMLHALGIEYYDWNASAQDATAKSLSADKIVANTLSGIDKANSDAMVLLHDAGNKGTTVDALPTIIETLIARGDIVFSKVDENTPIFHH